VSVPVVQDAGPAAAGLSDLLRSAIEASPGASPRVAAEVWTGFRAETGVPVVGYIRQRRMARARHLLIATTMSIPAIAASIGITDLQAFNKACRRELGASPRAIRAGACPGHTAALAGEGLVLAPVSTEGLDERAQVLETSDSVSRPTGSSRWSARR
jgi:hypothetical protein